MKKSFYLSSLLAFSFILGASSAKATAPVTVTTNTHDTAVCTGTPALFNIAASGTTLSYVWKYSTNGGATWDTAHNGSVYAGATTNALLMSTMVSMNGYKYKCIVSDGVTADSSTGSTLTVDTSNAGAISGPVRICHTGNFLYTQSVSGGVWSMTNAHATIGGTGLAAGASFGRDTVVNTITNTCGVTIAKLAISVDSTAIPYPITGPVGACVATVGTAPLANANNLWGSWTWSSSNPSIATVSSTGIATAVSAGVANISYVFTNGCGTVTTIRTFYSDVIPVAGTISGASALCAGTWSLLTSSVSGGAWVSGNTAVATIDPTGYVYGIAQGTSVISYYKANTCGSAYSTQSVHVDVNAGAISGVDSIGIGAMATFTNGTTGGTWSSNLIAIDSVGSATGVVTGMGTGTAIISYTVVNSCGTSTTTKTVRSAPAPSAGAIVSPGTVCVSGSMTATNTSADIPGVWSITNGRATINSAGLVNGVTVGKDTLLYTVNNAFGTSVVKREIIVVTVAVDSVQGPSIISLGGSYYLTGYPAGGTWSASNGHMASLVGTNFFVVIGYGTDTFTYTITNSCGTATKHFVINLATPANGVQEVSKGTADLSVYPNPANGTFTVNLKSDLNEDATVTITNTVGAVVKQLSTTTNNPSDILLDQPAGIYFINATTATGKYTSKVTVIR